MSDSRVWLVGANHFTNAKEVNENKKLNDAAHSTAGPMTGIQRFFNREILVLPPGSIDSCSSQAGSSEDKVGSTNRIMSDKLNHA